MTAAVLYAGALALLLGFAALGVERLLRVAGLPSRGVWAGALLLSWIVPAAVLLRPSPPANASDAGAAILALAEGTVAAAPTAGPGAGLAALLDAVPDPGPWVGTVWAVSAALALALFGLGLLRLHGQSRRWPLRRVQGATVQLSDDFGPAVVGLLDPQVVLPRWILELDGEARELVILHESEHRRTGDPWLLLVGTLLVLLAPWNPALWWQLRRLRLAVEVDCDRRVLGHGVSTHRYGSLLVDVGERRRTPGLSPGRRHVPVPAMAEPPSLLERRLTMMTTTMRGSVRTVGGALVMVGLAVAAACEAPRPDPLGPEADEAGTVIQADPSTATFEAVEVAPAADTGPVVMVDGEEFDGDLDDLDVAAIDRIEVVKGEAARALLGDRGAGGVIRIFLKEGVDRSQALQGGASAVETAAGLLRQRVVENRDRAAAGFQIRETDPSAEPGSMLRGSSLRTAADGTLTLDGPVSGLEDLSAARVYVDGVRLEGGVADLDLEPSEIDRVEIVRGEAAVERWGEEARGGVLRITTRR